MRNTAIAVAETLTITSEHVASDLLDTLTTLASTYSGVCRSVDEHTGDPPGTSEMVAGLLLWIRSPAGLRALEAQIGTLPKGIQ